MRARLRFIIRPTLDLLPDKIAVPGVLIGRAEDRRKWTLCFTADKQINAMVYEGNLQWLVPPAEHDFGKGVKFHLLADPTKYYDGPSTMGMLAEGELLG